MCLYCNFFPICEQETTSLRNQLYLCFENMRKIWNICVDNMHSIFVVVFAQIYMSHIMTKPTKWLVRPAKTQISLGIRPVWSESSLSAWRNPGSLATHWAHSEDSDQIGRMPRLIWVFLLGAHSFCWFCHVRLVKQFATARDMTIFSTNDYELSHATTNSFMQGQ